MALSLAHNTSTYRKLSAFPEFVDNDSGSSRSLFPRLFSRIVPNVWYPSFTDIPGSANEVWDVGEYKSHEISTVTTVDRVDTYPVEAFIQDSFNAFLESVRIFPQWVRDNLEGVSEINRETIEMAVQFIKRFHSIILDNKLTWNLPHLTTDGEGDVNFEWYRKGTALSIFIEAFDEIGYLTTWKADTEFEMEEGSSPTDRKMLSLWQWFLSRETVND